MDSSPSKHFISFLPQREAGGCGIQIINASKPEAPVYSCVFLFLATANTVVLPNLDGRAGHLALALVRVTQLQPPWCWECHPG